MKYNYISSLIVYVMLSCVTFNLNAQFQPQRHPYVEYLITLDRHDRTYKVGEKPQIKIEAYQAGIPLDGVTVKYCTGKEMLLPAMSDSTLFVNGVATIDMGTMTEPGFRECNLSFSVAGQKFDDVVKAAFEPERIKSFTKMPKDFKKFWDNEIEAARKVDLDPRLTYIKKHSTDEVSVYLIRLTVGEGGRYFYGYLSMPNDGKKHPAMFCPPGAGPYKRWPQPDFAQKGVIVLNVDIHGLSPESSQDLIDSASPQIWGYWERGLTSRDSCYFRQVYAGCVRCVDYLASLPEWDGETIVTMDGSQGGALSIITAALHDKVKYVSADYPALCDLTGFANGRAGGWPKYFMDSKFAESDVPSVLSTLPYYDVVNFARIINVPLYCDYGYNDDTCSPTSINSLPNEVKSPKTVLVTYTNAHFNYPENNRKASQWVLEQLFGPQ